MSEGKHTSGPWRSVGPDMFGDFNILHPADALAVAAVVSNMRPSDEVEANARLIAAAPLLLDACIQAEACMSIVAPRSDTAEYMRILDVVRAALAAATQATSGEPS